MAENSSNILYAEVIPDGRGGVMPCPALLTTEEAILFLRMNNQKACAKNTLRFYREQKKLRVTKIGKNLLYSRRELERFIDLMTS